MKELFISFSSKQEEEALRICFMLEKNGHTCFISSRDLVAGEEYAPQLLDNIGNAKAVVLLLSKSSNESPHVLREIEYAVSHKVPVIVYSLEEVELSKSLEYFLMTHQWVTGNSDKDAKLLQSVNHLLGENNQVYAELQEEKSKQKEAKKLPLAWIFAGIVAVVILGAFVILLVRNARLENAILQKLETEQDALIDEEIAENKPAHYKVGDSIVFGNYYDEPVEWTVLKINDDNTAYLISKYILSMKIYDAAEGGCYNYYDGVDYYSYENHIIEDDELCILARGNRDWETSNIRTWLNCRDELVFYPDQAPDRDAAGKDSYSNEPGFLYNFTDEEQEKLLTVGHDGASDKVFLLSSDELNWFNKGKMSIYAKPTESCLDNYNDRNTYEAFSDVYYTENYYWWLRDSDSDKINEANAVTTEVEDDVTYLPESVGIAALGVRPVIMVDLGKMN